MKTYLTISACAILCACTSLPPMQSQQQVQSKYLIDINASTSEQLREYMRQYRESDTVQTVVDTLILSWWWK